MELLLDIMPSVNVCLVHPPSIYDFRKRDLREGPISDVIPSTPVFEMYPVGFISMLSHLVKNGYRCRIANVAVQMLMNSNFDVEKYLGNIEADIFGIDLHWLPHTHGAFQIASIIRKVHPNSYILLGGYSASYFAEDIMKNKQDIDFILAGDLMEEQILALASRIEQGKSVSDVSNLFYRKDGAIKKNPRKYDKNAIANVYMDYKGLIKNAIQYHDIKGHLPYLEWIRNPVAMTLLQRGCQYNCGFCGGSYYSYSRNYGGSSPIIRDINTLGEEMEDIMDTIDTPVFIAGDLNAMGEKYYRSFLAEMKNRGIDLPLLTEYFVPPPENYYELLSKYVPDYACEISPDSLDQKIRMKTGRGYSNNELEKSISFASKYGSRKYDVYLSIGLPEQGIENVMDDTDRLKSLMKQFSTPEMPVYGFISPLSPFLDPGSLFYEMREKFGYIIRAKNIQEYYELLDHGRTWTDFLNYETSRMSRDDIARATYLSGIRMVEAEISLGYMDRETGYQIIMNIQSYMNGDDYAPQSDKSKHLTYLVKEIEWSRKHGLKMYSFMVFLYSVYEGIRRTVMYG